MAPSIWLAVKKWRAQSLQHITTSYVERIQTDYPELVVLKHTGYIKNDQRYVDISLLNDSSEIALSSLEAADRIDTTIKVIWHFAPDRFRKEAAQLRAEVYRLDSLMKRQDSIIKALD